MTTRKTRRTSASASTDDGGGTPGVPEQATQLLAPSSVSTSEASSAVRSADDDAKKPKRPHWARNLTNRQYRFVAEYLTDLRASSAVRRAFPNLSGPAVHDEAKKHMHNAAVLTAIDEAVDTEYGVTRSKIMQELARIAFHNPLDYFKIGPNGLEIKDSEQLDPDQAVAIAEVGETVTKEGGSIKLKLANKLDALEKLSKLVGANRQREDENTRKNNMPVNVMVVRFSDLTAAERASMRAPVNQARSAEDFDKTIEVEARDVTEGESVSDESTA